MHAQFAEGLHFSAFHLDCKLCTTCGGLIKHSICWHWFKLRHCCIVDEGLHFSAFDLDYKLRTTCGGLIKQLALV